MGYLNTTRRTTFWILLTVLLCGGCSAAEDQLAPPDTELDTGTVTGDADTDSNTEEDTTGLPDSAGTATTDDDTETAGSNVSVSILENEVILENQTVTKTIQTVLAVTWRQEIAADQVWLRFTFENDEWHESPKKIGTVGAHREVVLGAPEETDVTIQVMSLDDGAEEIVYETVGRTGSVPESVPRPTILDFNPALASPNRWMIGSVENSAAETKVYAGPFTIQIIDRRGRIVWYYLDQAWNPCMAYPRIAPEGGYIAIDRSERAGVNQRSVIKTTLDFEQFQEYATPRMTDGMALTDDGSIIYSSTDWLSERLPDGTIREIWSCPAWLEETGTASDALTCYPNTVNWNPLNDSILLSYPDINTVVEISRRSGEIIGQYGEVAGGWNFLPDRAGLECVHGGNITPEGTLLVSNREPGTGFPQEPVPHFFVEFRLDRQNETASEIWTYGEGIDDFPKWKGEAYRVSSGGNTLVNYGTGGIIREVTPDGQTAWHVKYDADFEHDYTNKMVGHTILIDDLYALTQGW